MTYKIDYYNMYLNHTINKLKDHFIKFLESLTDIIDFDQYIKVILVYYKLFNKFHKEENIYFNFFTNSQEILMESRNRLTSKVSYFPAYFSVNFHKVFNKKGQTHHQHKQMIASSTSLIFNSFQALDSKDSKLNKAKDFVLKTQKKNSDSLFSELIVHLNSKLMNWKSSLIEQDCEIKCRICETNIQAKVLVLHSYICSQKQNWKKKIKYLNEIIKKLMPKNDLLQMTFQQNDLCVNITNSPVRDAYFSNVNHNTIDFNFESNLFSPLLSNLDVY
jgi:hypothetical protein